MLLEHLDAVNETLLQQLCTDRCPESKTLDFKAKLPASSDKEKAEFLKDVSAFANADGGDLVYGIAEKEGCASGLTPSSAESADAAKRRLAQVLDAGIEPRIAGIRLVSVSVSGGFVLIVRVPASFDGPHRYHFNGHSKFVMRTGTHIAELTYDQLRDAFDRTATLADRARRFVNDRTEAIYARKTWRPLIDGPLCLAHLVPIASMAGKLALDMEPLERNVAPFMFSDWGGASRTLNLDGLVVHPSVANGDKAAAYTQVFRSGAFEAVHYGGTVVQDGETTRHYIPSTMVTSFYREAAVKFFSVAKSLSLSGPAILRFAMLKIEGYEFAVGSRYSIFNRPFADRPNLVLPDAWVEDVARVSDVDAIVRPMMHILWQAFDLSKCFEYSDQGAWQPRH